MGRAALRRGAGYTMAGAGKTARHGGARDRIGIRARFLVDALETFSASDLSPEPTSGATRGWKSKSRGHVLVIRLSQHRHAIGFPPREERLTKEQQDSTRVGSRERNTSKMGGSTSGFVLPPATREQRGLDTSETTDGNVSSPVLQAQTHPRHSGFASLYFMGRVSPVPGGRDKRPQDRGGGIPSF